MNKLLIFLLLISPLIALEVLTEAKVSYFIPTDARFRSTYGEDGIMGGLETSFHAGRHFYPWVSASLYDNTGHIHSSVKTRMYFIPVGAGLKYIYPFKYASVYGGVGVLPTYLHINHVEESKWGCGGIAKFGFLSNRLWNLFLDLFAEYSYIHISSRHPNPSDLSNFTIGGGVGYNFGGCQLQSTDEDE